LLSNPRLEAFGFLKVIFENFAGMDFLCAKLAYVGAYVFDALMYRGRLYVVALMH
jgi:hypothetical protein